MDTKFLVILALVAAASAVPIQESDKCSETCSPSQKFKYNPGSTYTYDYSVDTATNMAGASQDTARLTIQTNVDVHVMSPCEFALTLRNTQLMHSDATGNMKTADGSEQFRQAVEASELRFSFQDGVVDHICSASNEDAAVMNFKKGILSSFQNSMDDLSKAQNLTERDIAGECRTEYKVVSDGYYTTDIKKSKDVHSCTGRDHFKTMLQMTPYKVPSDLQSAPIMKTSQECAQEIEKGGVLKTSTCTETHVYRPFSNGNNGGVTTVKQSLTYRTYRYESRKSSGVISKDTLVFDHGVAKDSKMARVVVEQRLGDICESSRYDVRPESPRQFSDLVSAMKSLSEQDLNDLHKLLKTKTMCPDNEKTFKFFLDALPLTSTSASVKLMSSLISSKDVSGVLAQAWITSLGFVQNPTSEMIVSAKTLVDSEMTSEDALLPISSMINNYCRKMTSCDQDYAVLSIMGSLERNIGYRCDASGKKFEKVLLSLRAIGNAGQASRAVGPITKCLTSDSNPLEIRVAAAEAFRRMPCDAKDKDLWSTYENGDLDSELRVAAYLALMRCPSEKTMGKMAASLVSEEDDNVGAFVYSHLTNLRKTSDPHRQEAARAAQNLALDKEFELSALKFSRNYEISALINKLNMGFAAESNLVWSGQMPRSISGNLTVDLFGQAINLMDFGARMEGLEYLVKNLFGSYLSEEERTATDKKAKAEDVEGSIYGRVFGNEMLFMHSKTLKSPFKKMPASWLDLLIQLSKKQDYALTQSVQFMDVSMVVPTCAGLPIHLDVNGTGTVDLVLNGKMDLRKLGSSPRSLDIDGEIRPSAALEISGSMSVDAMVTRTGLRMRNTMHTSTALKGRVQLQRGQLLNVELDTPQEKMEVFSAGSKFFILHNDMEQEQDMIKENRQEFKVCSGSDLATVAGIELCGELSFPNASQIADSPYFPMTGPSSASLTLYKKDSHNGYKIFAKRVNNKKASIAQISLNTPGSKVDRAILLEMELNYPKQTFDATMRTPWKKAAIRGATIFNDKMKSVTGSLVIDDVNEYAITTEVKVDKSKAKIQFSPMVEIRRVGADNIQLTGYVSVLTPFKSADADLSLSGIGKMPYTLQTSISNTKKEKAIQGSFSTDGKNKYTLEASHQFSKMGKKSIIASLKSLLKVNSPTKQLISMMGSADYKEDKSLKLDGTLDVYRLLKKPANVKVALLKNAKKRGVRYDFDASLKSASVSGKIDSFTFMKNSGLISTKTVLGYTIPKVAKNKITLAGKFNDRSTKAYKKYSLKSHLDVAKNPDYNTQLSINVDHKKKHSEAEVEIKYGKNPKDTTKRINLSTSLSKKLATWKNAQLAFKMNAEAPAHNIDVSILGQHGHTPKNLDSSLNLNYGKGKDLKAEVTLKDKSSKLKKYNGKVTVSGFGSEYTLASGVDQKSAKQYNHVISLKTPEGQKHSITSMYKSAKADNHAVETKFALGGMKPVTVSGSTTLDRKNFDLAGEVMRGKAAYGFKTNTKVSKATAGKVDMEVYYPSRRMTLLLDGGKQKGKFNGRVEANWDANTNKSVIIVDGTAYMKNSKNALSLGGDIAFSSPFVGFEDLMTGFKYASDDSQHDFSSKLSLGGKGNMMSSTLSVKRPISLNNLKVNAEAKTPFKGFKVVSVDIDHSMEPTLKTVLAGRWEKENGKFVVEGEKLDGGFKGTVGLTSTMKAAKNIKLDMKHTDGNGKVASNAALSLNGKSYSYAVNMDHAQSGWNMRNTGDLLVTVPGSKVKSVWKHRSSDKDMKTSISSDMGKKQFTVEIDGTHDLLNSGVLSGNLKMETPWKSMKNVDFSINHKHGLGMLMNKASLKTNGKVQAASTVKVDGTPLEFDVAFGVESPYHEDINGKMSTKLTSFPVTGLAQISWAPKSKAVVEGSLNLYPTFDADVTVASPFHKDIKAKVVGKYTTYPMTGKAVLSWSPKSKAVAEGSLNIRPTDFAIELDVASPFHEDLSAKINSKYNASPMTGKAIISWAPKSKAVVQGSLNLEPSQFAAELDVASPFHEDINAKLNTKHDSYPMTGMAALTWAPKSKAVVEGSLTMLPTDFAADVSVKSPFYRDLNAKVNTKYGSYPMTGLAEFSWAPRSKAVVQGSLTMLPTDFAAELAVASPFHKDISAKVNTKHGDYPMTGLAELSWAPKAKATLEGSLNVPSFDDANADLKLTTPFRGFRNVVFRASNKNERDETVSHLNLDYGVRKSFDVESRFAMNAMKKMLRLKMRTPFDEVKSLDTGIVANGDATNFDGSVDFELVPVTGKFNGNVNWQYDDALKGSLRIDTPFKDYPYFELSTSSKDKDDMRKSFIQAEYYPRQIHRLDSLYRFEMPYSFEATISSPIPELDNVGVSFQHKHSDSDVVSHGEVTYQANKKIEGDLNMDWSSKVEGSMIVKTPFNGFKTNKIALSHDGDMSAFTSHGEMDVAEQKVSADASFKSGFATDGKFSFSSPIPGLENVEFSMNKRGNLKNVRGGAVFTLNGDESKLNFNNKMSTTTMKSGFNVRTPFTDKLAFTIDHNGAIDSFENKMSFNYGRAYDIDTVLTFSNRQSDISGNGMIKAKLNGPRHVGRVTFSKTGPIEDMAFSGTASYNGDGVSTNGSWKLVDGIEGSVQLTTPFDNFKNLAMTLSHTGDLYNFKSESSATYMDNQTINGKVELSSNGFNKIRFNSELYTPFSAMQSSQINVEHDYNQWSMDLSGAATLTTTIGRFGQGSISYSKSGNLDNFSAQVNGKYAGDEASVSVSKRGSIEDMTVSSSAKLNGEGISMDGSLKTLNGFNGEVQLKTPFTGYRNVGMKLSHQGEMTDFRSTASIDYTDNKNVNGLVELTADGIKSIKFSTAVNTPAEIFGSHKLSLNHNFNEYYDSMSSKTVMASNFGDASFQFSKSGRLNDFTVEAKSSVNGEEMINGKVSNAFTPRSLNTVVSVQTAMTPKLDFTINHNGDMSNFKSKAEGKLGSDLMSMEAAMSNRGNMIDASGNMMYRTKDFGSKQGEVTFHKEGQMNDFNVKMTGELDNKKIVASTALKVDNEITGTMKVNTPFRGYRNIGMSFKQTGSLNNFNVNAEATIPDGQKYSAKLDFYRYLFQRIETTLEVRTPIKGNEFNKFEYRHEGTQDSFTCYHTLEYGYSKKITYEMKTAMSPNPTMTVTLKTPFANYENMMGSASVVNNLPTLASVNGKLNAGNGNVFSLDAKAAMSPNPSMDATIKTPFAKYETMTASASLVNNLPSSLTATAQVNAGDINEVVSVDAKAAMSPNPSMIVTLKTPFPKYRDIMTSASLVNNLPKSFSVSGKFNAGGNVFSADASMNNNLPAASTVSAKIDANGSGMSLNGNLDISNDFSGSLSVAEDLFMEDAKADMSFKHSGDMKNFNSEAQLNYMNNQISGKVNFKRSGANIFAELRTPFNGAEKTSFAYRENNSRKQSSSLGRFMYGNNQVIEATQKMVFYPNSELMVTLKTPFTDDMSMSFEADVVGPQYKLDTSVTKGANSVSLESALDTSDAIFGSAVLKTPVASYKRMGVDFKHTGNAERFASEGKVFVNNKDISGKVNFHMYKLLAASLKTPFTDDMSMSAKADITGPKYKLDSSLTMGANSMSLESVLDMYKLLSVVLKTPFTEDIILSTEANLTGPQYKLDSSIAMGANAISLESALDTTSDDVFGSAVLKTPVAGYRTMGVNFRNNGNAERFASEGKVFVNNKDISGKVNFHMYRLLAASLKTPFTDDMSMSTKADITGPKYKLDSSLTMGANSISLESDLDTSDAISGSAVLKTPVTGYKRMGVDIHSSGNAQKFTGEGKVFVNNEDISGSINFDNFKILAVTLKTPFTEDMSMSYEADITGPQYKLDSSVSMAANSISLTSSLDTADSVFGSATLKTPVAGYRIMGVDFRHNGRANKFTSEGKVYLNNKDISGKVNFYNYRLYSVGGSAELKTPFAGFESTKADMKYRNRRNMMSASSSFEYGNGEKVDGTMKMTFSPNYDLQMTLNTPCEYLRDISVAATADLNAPSYAVTTTVSHNGDSYSTAGKLNFASANKIDGSVEVKTPIAGFESTKAEYEHKVDSTSVNGKASLAYDNERTVVSAELQSTIYPTFDATVTVKTPIEGYSTVEGSASYEKSYQKYETSSSFKVEGRNMYTMNSGFDYSMEPMRAFTKITTPFTNFRDVEVALTHEATSLYNFKSTGFLASPMTNNVNAAAALDFHNVNDMTASASVKSSMSGMDNLNFEVKTSEKSGEKKFGAVAGWTDGQEIKSDVAVRTQKSWYETSMNADVTLSTPFVALHSLAIQTEGTEKTQGAEGKLAIDLNGAQILDVNGEYSTKDRNEASVTFKQPRAMLFTASGSMDDVDVFANWDKNTRTSNARLVAAKSDKSTSDNIDRAFDITFEKASRKMGLSHTQKMNSYKLSSTGKVFWAAGDDNQVTYDLALNDNSRRSKVINDGSFKLGLPSRTLQLAGSFVDNRASKTADATFKWDADRDETQQVGVKATMATGKNIRGDVTLSMPALRKEIKVNGEIMLDNGKIILDSKTDISYSNDARKTLTVISKVTDISDYYSKNYSVELGLSHPYTNIDIQTITHVGSSDDKMTVGMQASYLTAKKQTKNLHLLSEIDMLKKEIKFQMNNMEVVGEVVSSANPTKLMLVNRMDDAEMFRSDVTYDAENQFAEISATANSRKLSLAAKYPTSKDFVATVTDSMDNGASLKKLYSLGVHLNNSRLLHSRVAWTPNVMSHFTRGMEKSAMSAGIKFVQKWAAVNNDIADEISGKYQAVTSHMEEEVSPLVDALERQANTKGLSLDMLIQTLRQTMAEVRAYDVHKRYMQFVESSVVGLSNAVYTSMAEVEAMSVRVEKALQEYVDNTQRLANHIHGSATNGSYVSYAMDKLAGVKNIDVSPYVTSFSVPDEYSNVVPTMREYGITSGLKSLWERKELDAVRGKLNSVYQQGAWAYKYWDAEMNIQQNLEHIVTLIKEIVEDELKELNSEYRTVYKNPITYWAPEQGEIQADLALPFELKDLQTAPDVSPVVSKVEKVANDVAKVAKDVAVYLPDQTTLDNVKQYVSAWFPETPKPVKMEQLKKSTPSKKQKKGGKRMKKLSQ